MGINVYKKTLVLWLIIGMLSTSLYASVYKTYTRWEIDALFVAWLISRYIEKDAEFQVVKKGTVIKSKYAINTPNSKFRRSGKETAFESALRYYHIDNNCSRKLIPIIRVLEMAPWRKGEDIHILNFEHDVVARVKDESILASFEYIDNYCKKKGDK